MCGLLWIGEFVEVYLKVLFVICEVCDCKGLYKLVCVGVIKGFIGIDDFYEVFEKLEVMLEVIDGKGEFVILECMVEIVILYLVSYGLFMGLMCL